MDTDVLPVCGDAWDFEVVESAGAVRAFYDGDANSRAAISS